MKKIYPGSRIFILCVLVLIVSVCDMYAADPVLIIRSEAVGRYLGVENPKEHARQWSDFWQKLLKQYHYKSAVGLESSLHKPLTAYSFIIMPGSLCLDEEQTEAVRDFIDKGGGILMLGAVGSRDIQGRWRGYDFLERLLNGSISGYSGEFDSSLKIRMGYGTPAAMLEPGCIIEFDNPDSAVYLNTFDSVLVDGYLIESENDGTRSKAICVSRRFESGGRITWLGANIKLTEPDKLRDNLQGEFFRKLFLWLNGDNIIQVSPWPGGANRCVIPVVEIDSEAKLNLNYLSMLYEAKVPMTLVSESADMSQFYSDIFFNSEFLDVAIPISREISSFPDLNRDLAYKTNLISLYLKNAPGVYSERMLTFAQIVEVVAGLNVGYYFGQTNESNWYSDHIVGSNQLTNNKLLFIPIIVTDENSTANRNVQSAFDEFGLDSMIFLPDVPHSILKLPARELIDSAQIIELVSSLKSNADKYDVWLANASMLSNWISMRKGIEITTSKDRGDSKISVINTNLKPAGNVSLDIIVPYRGIALKLLTDNNLIEQPFHTKIENLWQINLPVMLPGDSVSFILEWGGEYRSRDDVTDWIALSLWIMGSFATAFLIWSVYYIGFSRPHKHIHTGDG